MDIMDSILDLDFDKLTQPEQTAFMEGIQYADAVLLSYDMFTLEAVEVNNNSLVGKVKNITILLLSVDGIAIHIKGQLLLEKLPMHGSGQNGENQ